MCYVLILLDYVKKKNKNKTSEYSRAGEICLETIGEFRAVRYFALGIS